MHASDIQKVYVRKIVSYPLKLVWRGGWLGEELRGGFEVLTLKQFHLRFQT